jgi:uncharacterized protein YecT (DUF1311 family)
MLHIRILSLVFLTWIPLTALSEIVTPSVNNPYDMAKITTECNHAPNELELSECIDAQYQKAINYLDKLEQEIGLLLQANEAIAFQRIRAGWKEFVLLSCQFDASGSAGNSSAAIYSHCMLDYALARIKLLEKYKYCLTNVECEQPVRLHLLISPIR